MKKLVFLSVLLASGFVSPAAFGHSTDKVLFTSKDWQVRAVYWDDGTSACVAEVAYTNDTFSVWTDKTHPIRLQFFSNQWQFGEADSYVDLQLQIDDHQGWNLHHADRYKNSILFDLPEGDTGTQFLHEVANGSTLRLLNNNGQEMESYSLSGANSSIDALVNCISSLH